MAFELFSPYLGIRYYNHVNIHYFSQITLLLLQPNEWQVNGWLSNYLWWPYTAFMAKHCWAPESLGEECHQNSESPEVCMYVMFSIFEGK